MKRMRSAVSVGTVWASRESPRQIDEPALSQPAGILEWLTTMSVEEKLDLCSSSRIETQILYGTDVIALQESGDWVQVIVPGQRTRRDERGYPGWMPKSQLVNVIEEAKPASGLR